MTDRAGARQVVKVGATAPLPRTTQRDEPAGGRPLPWFAAPGAGDML
ncbi:hypothetical protein WME90_11665 [Sorangium sp. So ce375]